MISWTVRHWTFACTLFFALGANVVPARGQGFLDQLEKKAKEGLGLDNSSAKSSDLAKNSSGDASDLPAPTPRRTPPPPPKPSMDGATSILEAPSLLTPPTDRPAPAPTAADDGIYLGLEAESLTGGGIGARVVNVSDNSPAWRAGFKTNDVILAIDGFAISSLDAMVDRLSLRRPGDTIKVLVLRGTRNQELTAVLQNASVAQRIHGVNPNSRTPSPLTPAGNAWLGLVVADLSSAFRSQFGLRAYRAAAVTNVTKGSPADALSIQPGDAIVAADGRPIESARDLLDWMATRRPGDLVTINVMRGARATLMETTLGTDPKYQPTDVARPVASDPFAANTLNIDTVDNTVPAPVASDTTEVNQLRKDLKVAQGQIQSLEQRLAELESLLKKK